MRVRTLVVMNALVLLSCVLSGISHATPPTGPTVAAQPRPKPRAVSGLEVTSLTEQNGGTSRLRVMLKTKPGEAPLANKMVAFRLERTDGPALVIKKPTGADGLSGADFTLPVVPPGTTYPIKVSFAGDEETAPASLDVSLVLGKVQTRISLVGLIGPRQIRVAVSRHADSSVLPSQRLNIDVNGVTSSIVTPSTGEHELITLAPPNAPTWTVTVTYAGDATYTPTAWNGKVYTNPSYVPPK